MNLEWIVLLFFYFLLARHQGFWIFVNHQQTIFFPAATHFWLTCFFLFFSNTSASCVTRVLFSRCQVKCCLDGHVESLTIPCCSLFSPPKDTSPSGFGQIYWSPCRRTEELIKTAATLQWKPMWACSSRPVLGGRGLLSMYPDWWHQKSHFVDAQQFECDWQVAVIHLQYSLSPRQRRLHHLPPWRCSFDAVNNWLLCLPPAGLGAPTASTSSLFRHAGDLAAPYISSRAVS